MKKSIHYFRYDDGTYHKFGALNYLAIKSFKVFNPDYKIILHTNTIPYTEWFHILKTELGIDFELRYLDSPKIKYDNINHFIDYSRVKSLYEVGGLYSDLDYITFRSIDSLIWESKLNIQEECTDILEKGWMIILSIMYCKPNDPFVKKWVEEYEAYKSGKHWVYYSGILPTMIADDLEYWDNINLIPDAITNPFNADRADTQELFMYNRNFKPDYMIHCSESVTFNRFTGDVLTLEHIMTVDTTFTKLVRQFVEHLWDYETNRPFKKYI